MSEIVLSVEDVWKQYHIGAAPSITLRTALERYWARWRGKPDPTLPLDASISRSPTLHWALRGVSFQVPRGEIWGIVGRNGAGKSTLLKILSQVTQATRGVVKIRGSVTSLLEVGVGFHPELSGRENVFLNGAIMGMSRRDIQAKLDEITAFAEVGKYLDAPVKRYSSGMYVRLAFAVAAHLEADILIIDEVLTVGDASFQKRCLAKIKEASAQGKTVILVSHDMSVVHKLCHKGILLDGGQMIRQGNIALIAEQYLALSPQQYTAQYTLPPPVGASPSAYITHIVIENTDGVPTNRLHIGQPWRLRMHFTITQTLSQGVLAVGIASLLDVPIRTAWSAPRAISPGDYEACFQFDDVWLAPQTYRLILGLSNAGESLQYIDHLAYIHIEEPAHSPHPAILNYKSGFIINPVEVVINPMQ